MRRLHEAEVRRQDGRFIEAHRAQQLPRDDIAAGIAGNDNAVQIFLIQILLDEQIGQAVEQRHDIGADRVVIIRAQEEHRVAGADGGQNLVGDASAVETAALRGKVQTGFIRAAPAVVDGAVLQGNGLCFKCIRQTRKHLFAEPDRIGALVIRRVEHEKLWPGKARRLKLQKPLCQLAQLVRDSFTALRTTPLAAKLIVSAAVLCIPSYLTKMFVQQRLTQQGWAMEWLFLPGLLAGAAGMAGASLGRRLHPKRLRALYFGCALLVGTGTLLAGAAPALLCAAGPVLVQGALSVWFLHSMQRLNDAIPSDRRATLISVDSMAYSLLMIPASPLVGLVGDLTGQAGAGLCVLCALVVVSGLAAAGKTRYNGRGA